MTDTSVPVKRRFPLLILMISTAVGCGTPAEPVRVAAAASLRPAIEPLRAAWDAAHPGRPLELNFGASGTLFAQLERGLPCDAFLSADEEYPRRVGRGTVFRFASGRLTLWLRAGTPGDGLEALAGPGVSRVAVANPRLAPYGRAAEAALEKAGLADVVRPKVAYPGSVEEVAAALAAGAADAGFLPRSLANRLPAGAGRAVPLPDELAPPLPHAGVALTPAGEALCDFLLGPDGRAALTAGGFDP